MPKILCSFFLLVSFSFTLMAGEITSSPKSPDEIAKNYKEVLALEHELSERLSKLRFQESGGAGGFYHAFNSIKEFDPSLSPEDIALAESKATLSAEQAVWYQEKRDFDLFYDKMIRVKQAFIIEQTYQGLLSIYHALDLDTRRDVFSLIEKVASEYKIWDENRDMVGHKAYEKELELKAAHDAAIEKDPDLTNTLPKPLTSQELQSNRKFAYDKFFVVAKGFGKHLRKKFKTDLLTPLTSIVTKPLKYIAIGALLAVIAPAYYVAGRCVGNKTPLANASLQFTKWTGGFDDARYNKVKIWGQDYLNFAEKDVINLFVPSHRNTTGDNVLLAQIGLPDQFLFFKGSSVGGMFDKHLGNFIGGYIGTLPEFGSVGHVKGWDGLSPTDKMIHTLDKGITRNVVNYGQGFIASMHELLPITPHFVEKVIKPILDSKHKYKVRIYVVSYEVESTFLGYANAERNSIPFEVKISKPLEPALVKFLYNQQMHKNQDQIFDLFVRATWLSEIKNFGELSLEESANRIQRAVGFDILGELREKAAPVPESAPASQDMKKT